MAKGIIAMIIGAIALLGIDKVIDLVQREHMTTKPQRNH
jgi:HD-like signal output (HDOD) protein